MLTRSTVVLDASHLAAGDLVIGPYLPEPRRVMWSCPFTSPNHVRLDLVGGIRLIVGDDEPLLVSSRPPAGDPEWSVRWRCGLAGAETERRMLLTGPAVPVRDELVARTERASARWAGYLAQVTGEDPADIVDRFRG